MLRLSKVVTEMGIVLMFTFTTKLTDANEAQRNLHPGSASLGLSASRLGNSRLLLGRKISLDLLAAQDGLTLMIKQLLEHSDLVRRRVLGRLADGRTQSHQQRSPQMLICFWLPPAILSERLLLAGPGLIDCCTVDVILPRHHFVLQLVERCIGFLSLFARKPPKNYSKNQAHYRCDGTKNV